MYVNTVVDKICIWTNCITCSPFIQYSLAGPQKSQVVATMKVLLHYASAYAIWHTLPTVAIYLGEQLIVLSSSLDDG